MSARITTALKRATAAALLSLVVAGCFLSQGLFERERIWDPAWFGRYESEGVMFVVLPDDPVKRTYLVGSFEGQKTSVDTYRVALYRGWNDVMILGSITLGKNETRAVYTLLRSVGRDRFASDWPQCDPDFAQAHNLPRESDVCLFPTLETMRSAMKTYADEKAAKPPGDSNLERQIIERRRDHPLSTIGVTAQAGVFSDSEGVHGGLTLLDVPPGSPAAKAGLKRGDEIYGVGNPRPAIGEELLLRIAGAAPGSSLAISFFDGKTHAKRQTTIGTAALE